LIAAIRSIHTPVGWLEIRLPPGSAAALADQSGFTYCVAPAYGLSTRPGGGGPVVVVVDEDDDEEEDDVVVVVVLVGGGPPVQTVPLTEKLAGRALVPL
jgi:hypothetical protein